jgi:hypothetical protein
MNYSDLVIAIQDTVENSFTTDQLNTFITQAEQLIFNTIQLPSLRKNSTAILTANNKYLSTPADFLSVFSLAVIDGTGRYEYLLNKDVNFIRQAYPNPTSTAIPKYYAIFGPTTTNSVPPVTTNELSLILGPTPNAAYDVELHYFYYPESIVTAGQTWLGDNFDSALLNGSLIQALRFIKGEGDMIAMYDKLYLQSIALLKQLGDGKLRQDAYRSGQYRQSVS